LSEELQNKLRAGITAAKNGDRTTARQLLEQVISADEDNELAWLWLASSVNTLSERRACLERVLQINPNNVRAQEALARLNTSGETSAAPAADQARLRDQINRMRAAQTTPESGDNPGALPINTSLLIGISLIVVLILMIVAIFSVLRNVITPPPTEVIFVASETPTVIVTPTITETPIRGVDLSEITRSAPTLPPTLTATWTAIPSITPTPTQTPLGTENFTVLYTSLNSGAAQPETYLLSLDLSFESLAFNQMRDPAFSPDSGRIAFVRDVVLGEDQVVSEIFIVDSNGTADDEGRRLTTFNVDNTRSPSFSPDGQWIVFSSSGATGLDEELWLVNVDGTGLRQVTDNELVDRDPAWGADGRIAFTTDQYSPGLTEIALLSLPEFLIPPPTDISEPSTIRLTDSSGNNYAASWSQNGRWLVYINAESATVSGVYVIDLQQPDNGRLVTQDNFSAEHREPAISPDGQWVAFISNREEGLFQVYLSDRRGRETIRLTNNGRDDQAVIFRPIPFNVLEQASN
jgi:hypothetical protein